MMTNSQTRTTIDEISDGTYRISTPLPPNVIPGGFSFNRYLLTDEQPMIFHTGPRGMFGLTCEAISTVIPVERLRWIGFSHYEADECGALNDFLKVAPNAQPLCGVVNAMINGDGFDRPPRALADGEVLTTGRNSILWLDAPHLPHGWECGYLFEKRTSTLLCGDLFTQGGDATPPVTESDILASSESFRLHMDYYSHSDRSTALFRTLAATRPTTLACMHGSAWKGDGAALLLDLSTSLASSRGKS